MSENSIIPNNWSRIFSSGAPIIGMIHLKALPGAPGYEGCLQEVIDFALQDAASLVGGGVHGLMVENFGDAPFFGSKVPPETIAAMSAIALEIKKAHNIPLGINVLRNDGLSALGIACAVGADFIRVNILSGSRVTDQGVITGEAAALLRKRRELKCDHIVIMADINVKHSQPLGSYSLENEARECCERGGADALIVSGVATGAQADVSELLRVCDVVDAPVLLGSGVSPSNIESYQMHARGYIVGSYFKEDGILQQSVDKNRVKAMIDAQNESN